MAESQNIVKESLGDKESRLLRELEELKQAERITELEHELAELKARQKIKALEHQVEEQKRAEEVQKLKFRVEEVQDQPQLDPEQSCGKVPTRDPDTQPPAKTDRSRDLVPVESTTRDDAQQADSSQPTLAASIDSGASRSDSPALDRHNSASTPIDPPHNSAPAKMNNRPSSNDNVQREPSAPISMSEIGTSTRPLSTMEPASTGLNMEAATLQYYQELDGPADNSPELLFYDMDLEQLYDFASICEGNQEKKVGDLRMLSRLYYFIFTRTGTLDDIQKAIHRAEKAVEATHTDDVDYAPGLRDLIVMLLKKHERTNSLEDLDRAILLAEVMITVTPSFHYDRPHRVMDLVKMKFKKYWQSGLPEDLDEARFMATEVMSTDAASTEPMAAGPIAVARVIDQAMNHWNRYNETGDFHDLQMTIRAAEEVVEATPRDHSSRATILNNLTVFLQTRFKQTDDPSDLQMVIRRGEEAVEATPHNHPSRATMLNNLVVFLQIRFERTGDVNDLNMAIERGGEAVEAAPRNPIMLTNLANSLQRRFEQTGDFNDLQMVIRRGEEAVEATPHNHPSRATFLNNLTAFFRTRFEQTGNFNDLQMTIGRGKEAVEATFRDHPSRVTLLNNLASLFQTRFKQTSDPKDLQIAIKRGEEALAATPRDHPDRAAVLSNLAVCFQNMFEQTGDLNDLQMAIATGEDAVASTSHSHSDKATILSNLAACFGTRFEWTDDPNDLHMAIERDEEAIVAAPHNHPVRAAILSNLAHSLQIRFKRKGDINDLQKAIMRGEDAVAATPRDHSDRARRLNNLAICFHIRFERMGDLNDLQMAIQEGEETLALTPRDHTDRAARLSSLAVAFENRFQRMGDLNDLQMAITRGGEAIEVAPHDHPDRARWLNNLAIFFHTRFDQRHDLSDLQMAIATGKEAVAATPHSHPARGFRLDSLSNGLLAMFGQTGDLEDLEIAIARGEEAINATSRDRPDRAIILLHLANSLRIRSERISNHSDSKRAVSLLREATEMRHAPPRYRIKSALYAAELLIKVHEWSEASRITEIAVNLLPTVAPRQLKQQDQQQILGEFAGLAALAASTALEAGKDASHAVQLLELGRGIITGLRFGTRSDLTKLKEQHLEMAEKFERLREILDSPSPEILDPFTVGDVRTSVSETNQRHKAGFELEETIDQIRRLPNFEDFLRPLQTHQLMAAASQGPIILINVSEYCCDALLVETQAIRSIRLPDLRQSEITKNVELMKSIRSAHTSFSDATSQVSRMLEWLWDVAALPILEELGFLGPPPDDNWPRVWWIPTGQLSLLPLHAAGRHFPPSTEAVLDRVVSSYSPSIKALLYARQNAKKKNLNSAPEEALLVSMDTTPGHSDLQFAREEVRKLASILPGSISKVVLARPLREVVLSALDTCTMFHFAGHGESHPSDPSKSSLLVTDWKSHPLTVEHLIGSNLSQKSPWLAYLSACSTSESQAENLHDEAIHLVTACQLAGFQHVVGSLWEVSDRYSVNVAEEVYKTIVDGGFIDGEKVSRGVHNAVRRLRDITSQSSERRSVGSIVSGGEEIPDPGTRAARRVRPEGYEEGDTNEGSDPLVWAAYIHVGL